MRTHNHMYTLIHINSIDKDKENTKKLIVLSLDSEIADNFFSSLYFSVFSKFSISHVLVLYSENIKNSFHSQF